MVPGKDDEDNKCINRSNKDISTVVVAVVAAVVVVAAAAAATDKHSNSHREGSKLCL